MRFVLVAMLVAVATPARADDARELVDEGDALAAAGDAKAALAEYQKALALDPDRRAVYDKAIPLWIAGEDWPDATTWLEKATLRDPRYAQAWYALAYVYRRTARVAAAVGAYEEYVMLRPDDAAGRLGLAIADEMADDRDGALAAYRRYLRLETDPARATYRAQARAAIERLTPAPATWSDAASSIITGRATLAAWIRFAHP